VTWKVWEENILGQMSLLLQVLVHAQVREVLNVGGDLGQGLLENTETEKRLLKLTWKNIFHLIES
jgi:hypothetical protein